MRYKGMPVTDEKVEEILENHNKKIYEPPSWLTFPSNGSLFQANKMRKRKHEQFIRDVDLVVRFERRKKIRLLLADLGPHYLDNLRRECLGLPLMKVA